VRKYDLKAQRKQSVALFSFAFQVRKQILAAAENMMYEESEGALR
jgi:hypothetical protein